MPLSPILTCEVIDTNSTTVALTGDRSVLVAYYSDAKAVMSAQAQGGAAMNLDTYIIRNGSETGYGDEHTFYNVSSNAFSFSAEDSEGRVGQEKVITPWVDYTKLTCNVIDNRPDASGNMTVACRGDYFNDSFGRISNSLSVRYRYRTSGGSWSSYVSMSFSTNGHTYRATEYLSGLDYQTSYDFEFLVADELMSVKASSSKVKSLPVFHWGEHDVVFEVPVTFKDGTEGASLPSAIDGDFRIKGNLTLKGDSTYGNTLYFGDSAYCYIGELDDDEMTIKAETINLLTSNLLVDNKSILPEYGEWTPIVPYANISTQLGWYSKVGEIVTVGFYLRAYCYAGYEDEPISILGLPYTPVYSAAGGGMCSGALIKTNKNFQCFVAEENGTITTRAQECDDTASAPLTTSASGCCYASSGTLTLSGTITYMTY